MLEAIFHGPSTEQRRAIAKAITLLESTRIDHRTQADALLSALLPRTGKSFRLGISGVPGVGKSTFIEALGLYLIDKSHRVAVLTIDPSSLFQVVPYWVTKPGWKSCRCMTRPISVLVHRAEH